MPRAFSLLIHRGLHLASTWLPSEQKFCASDLMEKTMMWDALLDSMPRSLPPDCFPALHHGLTEATSPLVCAADTLSTVATTRHLSSRFVCFASLAPFGSRKAQAGTPWATIDGRVLLEAVSLVRLRLLTVESRLSWLARWEEAMEDTSAAVLRSDPLHCVRVLCHLSEGLLPWASVGSALRRSLTDGLRAGISAMPLSTLAVTLRALHATHAVQEDEVLYSLVTPMVSRMTALMRNLPPPPYRRGLEETALALQSVTDVSRCPATGVAELLGEVLGRESSLRGTTNADERAKCVATMSRCASPVVSNAFVSGFLRPPSDDSGSGEREDGEASSANSPVAVLVERLCVVSVFCGRRKGLVRSLRTACLQSRAHWSLAVVEPLASAAYHLVRSGVGQPEAEDIEFLYALEQGVVRHIEPLLMMRNAPQRNHEMISMAAAVLRAVAAVFELDEALGQVSRPPATALHVRNGNLLASAAAAALRVLSSSSPSPFHGRHCYGGDGLPPLTTLAAVAAMAAEPALDDANPASGGEDLRATLAAIVQDAPLDALVRWMDTALTTVVAQPAVSPASLPPAGRFVHGSLRSGREGSGTTSTLTTTNRDEGPANRRHSAAWWLLERVAQRVGEVLRLRPDAVDGVMLDLLGDQVLRLHRSIFANKPPLQPHAHPVGHAAALPTTRCRQVLRDVWLRIQSHSAWSSLGLDARQVAATATGFGSGAVAVCVALSELSSLSTLERVRRRELLRSCAEILSTSRHWLPSEAPVRGELLLRFLETEAALFVDGHSEENEDNRQFLWVKHFFENCLDDSTWLEGLVPLPGLQLLLVAVDREKSSPLHLAMRDITLTAIGRHAAQFQGIDTYPVDVLLTTLLLVHRLRVDEAPSASSLQHTNVVTARWANDNNTSRSNCDDAVTRCARSLLTAIFSQNSLTEKCKRERTLALTLGLLIGVRDEELRHFAAQLPGGTEVERLPVAEASPDVEREERLRPS